MCGDPWLKKGFATNFETRPRTASISHYFCSFFYWSFQCNFVSFFAGRNAASCPTEYFLRILNKRPAAGSTFQCFDRRQKELIPSIWSPSKNRHYILTKTLFHFFDFYFIVFFFLNFCLSFFILFLFFYLFLIFSLFPRKFLKFKGWPWIWGISTFFHDDWNSVVFFLFFSSGKKSKFLKFKVSPWI